MEPLSVEVDSSSEGMEVNRVADITQCLLRAHTDECLCGTDVELIAEFGGRVSILNCVAEASYPPLSMCTDRQTTNYCPFGDPADCNCLELFTSTLSSLSAVADDTSYIEELLDELSSSLDTPSDIKSINSVSTTSDLQERFSHMLQLTSTPIRRRSCVNPVLANIVSPVFDKNSSTTGNMTVAGDESMSGMNSVFRGCDLNESLEYFGMAGISETDSVCTADGCLEDGEDTRSMDISKQEWWALEGPYTNTADCTMSQLLLPKGEQIEDSWMLFF